MAPCDKKDGAEVADITSPCSATYEVIYPSYSFSWKKYNQQLPFQPVLGVLPYPGCILSMNWINSINAKKAH